jgi:hypothetical protein
VFYGLKGGVINKLRFCFDCIKLNKHINIKRRLKMLQKQKERIEALRRSL